MLGKPKEQKEEVKSESSDFIDSSDCSRGRQLRNEP
jgi:hypothetical protein